MKISRGNEMENLLQKKRKKIKNLTKYIKLGKFI